MRKFYDFSKGIKNPYAEMLKKQITIRLDDEVISYFKNMSDKIGKPYQNIINYYLLKCVKENIQMDILFKATSKKSKTGHQIDDQY